MTTSVILIVFDTARGCLRCATPGGDGRTCSSATGRVESCCARFCAPSSVWAADLVRRPRSKGCRKGIRARGGEVFDGDVDERLEVRPEDEEAVAAAAAEVGELEVGFFKAVLELLEVL